MSSKKLISGDTSIDISYVTNSVAVYNLTVDVVRMTKVKSSEGMSESPETIVNLMPCHIQWLSGREKLLLQTLTTLT